MLGSSPLTLVLFLSCLSGGFFATRGLLREGVSFGCWMWAAKPPVMLESECGSLFPLLFPSGCFSSFCASGFAFSHQKEQVHVCSACRCELDFFFLIWRILALQCWLVSGVQWREPAVGVHTSPPSWNPLFPVPTIPLLWVITGHLAQHPCWAQLPLAVHLTLVNHTVFITPERQHDPRCPNLHSGLCVGSAEPVSLRVPRCGT